VKSTTTDISLSSITPSTGVTNTTVSITDLAGSGFTGTPTVYLKRTNYNNIPASSVSTVSSTKLTASLNLNNRAPGTYQVCVANSGSEAVCGLSYTIYSSVSAANGSIYFTSTPSGAAVYLDSVSKGNTPVTVYNITPGTYTVKIQRASFLEWSDRITVTAGNETTVNAKMTSISSTITPTTIPPTIKITTATLPPTTVKSSKTVPTPWADATTATPESPLGIAVVLYAVIAGIVVLGRK